MNAILINISKVHDTGGTQNELIRLLTDLFDERLSGAEKVEKLKDDYDLKMTKQIERKVEDMCTYSIAMEKKGIEQGMEKGIKKGERKRDVEVATDMLKEGDPISKITRISHLSQEMVLQLAESMGMGSR